MIDAIGFIGLGAMGIPMVTRLLGAGITVHVHDTDEVALRSAGELGAAVHASAREVASRAECVLVSLPTPDVVRKVAAELALGTRMRLYVDLSTTGARVAREVADNLATRGMTALDAPVSGGVAGARAGTLAIMAAGDRAAFERIEPVLKVLGRATTWVGPEVGQGQTLKLANNLLAATTFAAALEAFAFAIRAGLDGAVVAKVINASTGRSFPTETLIPNGVLNRAFAIGFRLELMAKDVGLCLDEAAGIGLDMPVCEAARNAWADAMAEGLGTQDFTALARIVEARAGVEIASKETAS
jgi:3-hydroxyisobutyrate dehydrogenase-like beta-hydroxyacid dehydrogenase